MPEVFTPKLAISLMDNTSLNTTDTQETVQKLIDRSVNGTHTAAICIYPEHVKFARGVIQEKKEFEDLKIATVVNFPEGNQELSKVEADTRQVIEDGADEVDVVINYKLILENEQDGFMAEAKLVKSLAEICNEKNKMLKVILETGELKTDDLIEKATKVALENGAHFVKTSTGKVPENATLRSASIMLNAIKVFMEANPGKKAGFKAAGGIKIFEDAKSYLETADNALGPDFLKPETFRFGASSLLDNLRAATSE